MFSISYVGIKQQVLLQKLLSTPRQIIYELFVIFWIYFVHYQPFVAPDGLICAAKKLLTRLLYLYLHIE